ncbi:MAG TPA: hypothetical protein VKB37_02090 [Jatrophihabitantaceae bacterium]|nr:hypothetical protein [Jatrophihabitantaceae bacterium]
MTSTSSRTADQLELSPSRHAHSDACWWHLGDAMWICAATSQVTSWPILSRHADVSRS